MISGDSHAVQATSLSVDDATDSKVNAMKPLFTLLTLASALLFAPAALAAGKATPDEAKAMAIKAADYMKVNGPEKAFAAFNAKDGPWRDRDLYVFVENDQAVMMMHGNNPGLAGKNVATLRDASGKSISDRVLAIKDTGWVEFNWQNPLTGKIEPKTDYVIRVGEYLVGVGAYVQ